MTETELTDPGLQAKRQRLDIAKLVLSAVAAATATAALIVSLLVVGQTSSVTGYISDCTTPTGQCYQQIQKSNAENRQRLVDADIAAQVCGNTARTVEQMQACVTRTLEDIGGR